MLLTVDDLPFLEAAYLGLSSLRKRYAVCLCYTLQKLNLALIKQDYSSNLIHAEVQMRAVK
jgi:hypothetical protein